MVHMYIERDIVVAEILVTLPDRSSGVKRVNINNVDLSPSKKQYCLLHPASNAYRILRIRRKMIDL